MTPTINTQLPHRVSDIQAMFRKELNDQHFIENTNKTGSRTIEVPFVSFLADEPSIFGKPNEDWIARERAWYLGQSLNVNDIPGKVPAIWVQCATPEGEINSNYGWAIFSEKNGHQFDHAVAEIGRDPQTRRAIMIYTRPRMWYDYDRGGMSDFMCTNTVQYLVRNGHVHAHVCMRSNDAVFGYSGDYAWQKYVLDQVASKTGYTAGHIVWNVGSLHVYERHFDLVRDSN